VLNFEVINPWTGKPCRPVLVLWYDTRSNMPLGWELMPTENTQSIHVALRRAIITLGKMPKVAYLDNGKAFRAKHFTNSADFDNGAISGLYSRLGIQTSFATPYHGQAKTVERFFGSLLEMESIMPTYTGNSIDNKPARLHRGESLHRKLWERYGMGQNVLTIVQAHHIIAAWFDEYAQRPQRGHLNGKSPIEEIGRAHV
jgi:putative transposase